jgi:hypothetical protein
VYFADLSEEAHPFQKLPSVPNPEPVLFVCSEAGTWKMRLHDACLVRIKTNSFDRPSVACFRRMPTYRELVDLATSCADSARLSTSSAVAYQFWQMALDYAESAAKLNDGKRPAIGEPPIAVVRSAPDYSNVLAK